MARGRAGASVPAGVMPAHFDAAFVESHPSLRWLSNNAAKYPDPRRTSPSDATTQVWTALSSPAFGKRHKFAQEQLEGSDKEAEVLALMLEAIEVRRAC
eukprot:893234-Pleurochrysis_carterae.AAC.1